MKTKTLAVTVAAVIGAVSFAPSFSFAGADQIIVENSDGTRDKATEARMREAARASDRAEQDRQKESMRDKSHDGLRLKTGDNTSTGVDKDGINVRRTTP